MSIEVKTAVVQSIGKVDMTSPDIRDRSLFIFMDYGGSGQGFGGWHFRFNGALRQGVQRVTDAATPEEMVGKPLRVLVEDGLIRGVAHIVKDDLFFDMPTHIALLLAKET